MSDGSAKVGLVFQSRDLLPLTTLLHCRTVVESQNFVTTGLMTSVDGELFEVELHEFESFVLGESVKLTIYSPAGIQTFPSKVFAKYAGAIALIQPPQVFKRFEEKREHPRVEVSGKVQIVDMLDSEGRARSLDKPIEGEIRNISLSGTAFAAPDLPELNRKNRFKANVDIGFGFLCELEIIRRERHDEGIMCGARMQVLEPEMMRPLRALILKRQVERNIELRKENQDKKST